MPELIYYDASIDPADAAELRSDEVDKALAHASYDADAGLRQPLFTPTAPLASRDLNAPRTA